MDYDATDFYNAEVVYECTVPLVALEHVVVCIKRKESPSQDDVLEAYKDAAGRFMPSVKLDLAVSELNKRMSKDYADTPSKPPSKKGLPPKSKSGFGTSFSRYLEKCGMQGILYRMVGYDYGKAHKLYTEVDSRIVRNMVSKYVEDCSQTNRIYMEACVYGFGGSIDGDGGDKDEGDVTTHDAFSPAGMGALDNILKGRN